jgi:hypothetical protein
LILSDASFNAGGDDEAAKYNSFSPFAKKTTTPTKHELNIGVAVKQAFASAKQALPFKLTRHSALPSVYQDTLSGQMDFTGK